MLILLNNNYNKQGNIITIKQKLLGNSVMLSLLNRNNQKTV